MILANRMLSVFVLAVSLCALGNAQRPEPNVRRCLDTEGKITDPQCLQNLFNNKADQSKLNEKTTELDNKLNNKANKTELNNKADKIELENINRTQNFNVHRFWVLLAAVLVFFMQAGFKCLEVGMVKKRVDTLQASQKLFSWITTYIGYVPLGFGIMFGITHLGWVGTLNWPGEVIATANKAIVGANNAIPDAIQLDPNFIVRGLEFFLFQAAFAATAVTIPAGATAERMSLKGYILLGIFIAAIVYPFFGHLAWGGSIYSYSEKAEYLKQIAPLQGWLQKLNFHDFAGSTVVHSVGGWFALIGSLFLGSRPGRFKSDGTVNLSSFPSRSRGYAILGVFMLWFGWWGFNGGSKLTYDTSIAGIILNTNLAGAASGLAAYLFGYLEEKLLPDWFQKGLLPEKVIGGVLGGLVAITASCDRASPFQAFLIGLAAGIIHNLVFDLLLRCKVDDPVGAVPVHAGCGVLGTICVAFTSTDIGVGRQFLVQLLGVLVAFVWSVFTAAVFFSIFRWRGFLDPEKAWMDNLDSQTLPAEPVS